MLVRILGIFALAISLHSSAQNLSQTVVSTSGDHFQNGAASISWTIGEPVVNSLQNGSVQLTQGFHQPYLTVSSVNESENAGQVRVYPNPVNSIISIEFSESGDYSADLFDVLGRKINTYKISGSHYDLDLNDFPAANYLIRCFNAQNNQISTFKIQKIR